MLHANYFISLFVNSGSKFSSSTNETAIKTYCENSNPLIMRKMLGPSFLVLMINFLSLLVTITFLYLEILKVFYLNFK